MSSSSDVTTLEVLLIILWIISKTDFSSAAVSQLVSGNLAFAPRISEAPQPSPTPMFTKRLTDLQRRACSRSDGDTYVASVVEYAPVSAGSLANKEEVFPRNAAKYVSYISQASEAGADIIVFPEVGLSSYSAPSNPDGSPIVAVVIPEIGSSPCDMEATGIMDQGLRNISCAAREFSMYVIVNLPEKRICGTSTGCESPNDVLYHNTNVAFDRNGVIISRYRKFHLFGEAGFTAPPTPDFAIFDTDFGVRFGMITCFDIMFEQPAMTLVNTFGVTDILFPTAWFSEAPFLTAAQTQGYWAFSNNVNLLASGHHYPGVGSSGSGVYNAKNGPVVTTMPTNSSSRLLTTTICKIGRNCSFSSLPTSEDSPPVLADVRGEGLFFKRDKLEVYNTKAIVDEYYGTLCSEALCCDFDVALSTSPSPGYGYRAVVFDGVRSFDGFETGGLQVCAIIPCDTSNLESCGRLHTFDSEVLLRTSFQRLQISGKFEGVSSMHFANTMGAGFMPLSPKQFSFTKESLVTRQYETSMTVIPGTSLYTFGIYTRIFTRDGQEAN